MDVMYSLYKLWTDMILSGQKPLEFRTKLPKELKPGTKIYLYETRKHGGAGAVVGECTVSDIIPVLSEEGKWPICGNYPFLEFFCENVLNDAVMAEHIRMCKTEFKGKPENYRYGYLTKYMFSPESLDSLRETGHPIDIMQLTIPQRDKILKDFAVAEKLELACDDWLTSIGFYNSCGETNYRFGLVLANPIRYANPKPISDFTNTKGERIEAPPQSYCYASM